MHRSKAWFILFCFIYLCGCGKHSTESEVISLQEIESIETIEETEEDNRAGHIFVYVCGAVNQEGVYEFPEGSRVFEAVEKAGGFTEDAATAKVNLAEILQDETRLYIPTIEELTEEQMQNDGKVNLNTASREELMMLPGVGESKAALIIQYREEHGAFQKIEDVMNIAGIKEGLFTKIKDYIKI